MSKTKPLDQMSSTSACALNHATKIQNKIESHSNILKRLMEFASSVPYFRRLAKENNRHRLSNIILLIVLGRASKCVGRAEIIEFGRHNLSRFRKMDMFRNGIPSEATLRRIENGIDDLALVDRMQDFVGRYHCELLKGRGIREIICIDGKAECGTVLANGRNPDIVSAYASPSA